MQEEKEEYVSTLRELTSARSSNLKEWLSAIERRVAMLYAAGMNLPTIAIEMCSTQERVMVMLKRPHVARYVTQLTAAMADEIAPVARRLTEELEAIAGEALDRQVGVMRTLDAVGDERLEANDFKNGIRAKLGVITTTQDILDRAGKRAPTRTIGAVAHVVAPESLERLERIMTEVKALT